MSWTLEHVALSSSKQMTPAFSETTGEAARLSSDTLLQASRRLDWRFLLPDPNLEQVAYFGQRAGSLLEALELFATSVRVYGTTAVAGAQHSGDGQYDVVVASAPTTAVLQQAVALVRPGGSLYIEVCGPMQSFKSLPPTTFRGRWTRPRLGRPVDYVEAIQKLGLRTVEPYWFWPNFEACTKIIPLWDQTALLYALAPRQPADSAIQRWQMQARRWLVQSLNNSGLLDFMVPCFGIVAR